MANEIGDTELGATKQELIEATAQKALIKASVTLGTVRDVSARAIKGAETISFPKFETLFTVEKRGSATAGNNQNPVLAKDTLALSERAHIQWLVDSHDALESTLSVDRELIELAGMEHGRQIDIDCNAEFEAAGIETATAGNISQDIVLQMRRILMKNKANPQRLYLKVGPDQEELLLKIDPFVSAEKYGNAIIPQGVLGLLYGVKVILDVELAPQTYYMYDSMGFAFGFQRGPQFDEAPKPEFGAGSKLQVLDQKYGLKALAVAVPRAFQADGTTPLDPTESAWIVKDAN
jgi:hypothetical protein